MKSLRGEQRLRSCVKIRKMYAAFSRVPKSRKSMALHTLRLCVLIRSEDIRIVSREKTGLIQTGVNLHPSVKMTVIQTASAADGTIS